MLKKKMHYSTMLNLVVIGNVLFAIFIIGTIFGTVYCRYMKESVRSSLENNVGQIENYTSLYVENIRGTAEKLAMDVELGTAVEEYLSPDIVKSVRGKRMMDYILQSALSMNSSIENIAIGTENKIIQQDGYSIDKDNRMMEVYKEDWYKDIQSDKINWKFTENIYYKNTYEQIPYYLYATKFKNKFYQKRDQEDRVIIVTFNITELEKYIDGISNISGINVNIWENAEGQKNLIYQAQEDKDMEAYLLDELPDEREKKKLESQYIFIQKESLVNDWKIVGNIRQSTFDKMAYRVEPWMIMAVSAILLVSVIISHISSRAVSRPMKKLVRAMEDIEQSEFRVIDNNTGCIEMYKLIGTYNHMSGRIKRLIEDIKLREAEKRKIEFQVLEAQINPHFIYNTLEAVKWVAHVNQSDKIADIIESFVRLLRISLSEGHEMITVENEIILVKEYAKIMIFRNNYDIDIAYEIAPETYSCSTLKLVLQPFVENCFFHAFINPEKENSILIKSSLEDGALVFEVIDNGAGFLVKDKNMKQMTGIGIDNVDERIKAWHGREYGVLITSEKNRGTTVRIRQPILKEGETV